MVNEVERRRWNDELMVARWPKRERYRPGCAPRCNALQPAAGEGLDIGAGGGKLSLAIARGNQAVRSSADISDGMVNLATGRAGEAKAKGVSFMAADVQVDKVPGGPLMPPSAGSA
jgi:2-polyprenyl-3-methyl-5-hydroxy-6-metoxy-1,4-benzoquinol methylase